MKSTLRKWTADEKRALSASRKYVAFGWRSWATTTGFAFLAAAILVSFLSRHYKLDVPTQWTLLTGLIAIWSVVSIPLFSRLRNKFGAAELIQDIRNGMVSVQNLDIDQVIEMEEFEDLGSAYFVRDIDKGVYFLIGQYLYDAEENESFPCTRIEIVRAPRSGIVLNLKCSGNSLEPLKKIGPFRQELVRGGKLPEDGSAIPVDWDDIERTYA